MMKIRLTIACAALLFVGGIIFLTMRTDQAADAVAVELLPLWHDCGRGGSGPSAIDKIIVEPLNRYRGASGLRTAERTFAVTNRDEIANLRHQMDGSHTTSAFLPSSRHWSPDREVKLSFLTRGGRKLAMCVSLDPEFDVARYSLFVDPECQDGSGLVIHKRWGSRDLYHSVTTLVGSRASWVEQSDRGH